MKIAILMNKDSYVGREYAKALIEAGLEFSVISIGNVYKGNEIEDHRCGGLWQPISCEEISKNNLVKCFYFSSLNDQVFLEWLDKEKFDLAVQGGTGILKEGVFNKFRLGILNFHPGDLPCYRGCSAPEWQLYEKKPIISTCHLIDSGIDTGPIYKKKKLDIDLTSYINMRASIYPQTAKFVVEVINEINKKENIKDELIKQDESLANYRSYIGDDIIKDLIRI